MIKHYALAVLSICMLCFLPSLAAQGPRDSFFANDATEDKNSFTVELPRRANSRPQVPQPKEQPLVEVFVADWCPHCRRLEEFLTKNKISYTRRDVERDKAAQSDFEFKHGGGGIPLVRVGSEVMRGFNASELSVMLKNAGAWKK